MPDVVAGQIDVFPAQRREVRQKPVVNGLTPAGGNRRICSKSYGSGPGDCAKSQELLDDLPSGIALLVGITFQRLSFSRARADLGTEIGAKQVAVC